ncbi:MAG: signal peptidase I [Ruminococcus sp.]
MLRILKKAYSIFLTLLLVFLLALVAATLFIRITGDTPSLFGLTVFRVSSESMMPELEVGDVIICKAVKNPEELKKGDIITYRGTQGEFAGKLITHQVVTEPYEKRDSYYLITKGTANPETDPEISFEQVMGKLVHKSDVLSVIYSFFITPWGLVITLVLIILAFFGEFYRLLKKDKTEPLNGGSETDIHDNTAYDADGELPEYIDKKS